MSAVGLDVERGRLPVDDSLHARDHPHVFALRDAAAVPDLSGPQVIERGLIDARYATIHAEANRDP